jgi:hypothetical protein
MLEIGQDYYGDNAVSTLPYAPRAVLTVSDIERLAKAGVKIEFENVKDQVRPDPTKKATMFGQVDEFGYMRDFLRRWDRAQPADPHVYGVAARAADMVHNFDHVSIFRKESTFHVFVVLSGGQIGHLTDPAEVFPSEALIAKVFLLQKEGKADGDP